MKKIILMLGLSIFLFSCSSTGKTHFKIDSKTYRAKSYDNRIKSIVLHYTAINNEKSIRALTEGQVSSHYLITDKEGDPIYSLVDDQKRAWHAGKSEFSGRTNLNDSSIGIEIVNLGYVSPKNDLHPQVAKLKSSKESFIEKDLFIPYDEVQIRKVAFLVKELSEKYRVAPKFILGHSDISFDRKKDPGPLFPWKQLYEEYGIGAWYEEVDKLEYMNPEEFSKMNIEDIKAEFRKYGYELPKTEVWDVPSVQGIYAFQMHFRPENIDGIVDLETLAILKALNKKYR